ncbi:MAG: BTAD domain-containing putative transcriptional regulator, partial [Thermoanaerobaculia bacterium]|nr:BTAD domain-containing putative transcriptional regulator [Thermoanaerobaculia bacterium]
HPDDDVCPRCVPHLEAADDLYGGPFLAGFSLRDAPDFDDWTRVVAENLQGQLAAALERLSAATAATGDYHRSVGAARRWVDLDPLHEPAHRNLMLISAWAGDRAGAIDAYRRCVGVLNEELGVPPIAETTELYEAILDEDLPPAPGQRRRVRAETVPRPEPAQDLIARRSELASLESELAASSRAVRVALVEGEAWMGRTRLLEEFVTRATGLGHTTLVARGYPAEQALPHGVVVQLLRAAHRQGLLDPEDLPDWVLGEVARLLPEIGSAAESPAGTFETRLFDAVTAAFAHAARSSAIVIGVDDFEFVDEASASLLSYLRHRLEEPGMLLILTAGPSLAEPPEHIDAHITRDPLPVEDLATVGADDAEAAQIVEDTGGVPLLVGEHLGGADRSVVTAGMRTYVDVRLASLTELAMQVVSAAAVLGGTFDAELLRSTSGRSEEEVADAVEELVRRRILRELPGGGLRLGFALYAIEQTLYDSLSPVRRRLLHGRAADALERARRVDRDAAGAVVIADHLRLAGRESDAADWYAAAGDLAASIHATTEAEGAYRAALAMGHPDQ